MIPITDSAATSGTPTDATANGVSGSANRRNPYEPSFSSTPASSTEPAVGSTASAKGTQVWNGNNGTLIANPANSARNTPTCVHCQVVQLRNSKLAAIAGVWARIS